MESALCPPALCRGWSASGPGKPLPGAWFLTGGGAEAPPLKVGLEDAFCEAVLKGSSGALDDGGAPPDTERAIPGAEPQLRVPRFPLMGTGLGGFPPPSIVVFAGDCFAITGDPVHTVIIVPAECTWLVASSFIAERVTRGSCGWRTWR
jgi:hypothetical protein